MRFIALTLASVLAALQAAAQMDHSVETGRVTADATVNAVSEAAVNVTHGPIPAIGWPAMTMDMPLLDGVDASEVKPGDAVVMTLEKGADGMYGVRALAPK